MLKQWIPAVKPEKEELEKRLNAAQEELGRLQMQIKEHKLPVLVLIEGWGAAGKGSTIGGIIKNIDPRFFKVASMSAPTDNRCPSTVVRNAFSRLEKRNRRSGWKNWKATRTLHGVWARTTGGRTSIMTNVRKSSTNISQILTLP